MKKFAGVLVLSAGVAMASQSAMACAVHIIVKNNFQNAAQTVQVSKLADLKNVSVASDTLTNKKLLSPLTGKSEGQLVLSAEKNSTFEKTIVVNVPPLGDCQFNFDFKEGKFSFKGDKGKACELATTVLKRKGDDYLLILAFGDK